MDNSLIDSTEIDTEFSINQIKELFIRNKFIFYLITGSSIALQAIIYFLTPPTFKGELQIVLRDKSSQMNPLSQLARARPELEMFLGASGQGKVDLRTEKEILKSPSVLMPIFQKMLIIKKNNGKDLKNLRYNYWIKNNLDINLTKGTSVLNLSYLDNDKELISEVLKSISNAYQDYSRKDRLKGIQNGIIYLEEQITLAKKYTKDSLIKAQDYANKYDLSSKTISSINQSRENSGINNFVSISNNIESIRLTAANNIRKIDEQINLLNLYKNDNEFLLNLSKSSEQLKNKSFTKNLHLIDNKIEEKSLYFKNTDPEIIELKRQKKFLIENFQKKSINYLKALKQKKLADKISSQRPKEVLVEHRSLLEKASRDQATLIELENQLRLLSLEEAKSEDPWELITNPTVYDKRISPRKGRSLALGLFGGLFFGFLASYLKELKSDIIFSKKRIESTLGIPILTTLNKNDFASWEENIQLLIEGAIETNPKSKISIIKIGNFEKKIIDKFHKIFSKYSNNNINIYDDFIDSKKSDLQIIICSLGMIKLTEIRDYKVKINLQGKSYLGLILLA